MTDTPDTATLRERDNAQIGLPSPFVVFCIIIGALAIATIRTLLAWLSELTSTEQ